ncbi:uncharacterized protein RHOBADRAFT_41159 [Rhodotorula graminis WP1]|uniref:TRP C-terminal domain-containing protein n=1 Tax=Rhodotorula graminis (strain WP1) TaxID=578459 RepID=A0A194SDC1_RHOGW|nr:uncharacterized protein RHOBADRAFT_41159 [Rhodotorula graminis WP1]KPV78614.1 hypothetical protein RHOBADRAFT_41159 [Rhodotorula graminis WP1]
MRKLHPLALAALAAPLARAEVLWSRRLSSCIGSGDLVAPVDQQLVFTDLYAQFDQGQTKPGEYHAAGINLDLVPSPIFNEDGAVLTGTGDLLRIVLVGNTVATSEGFSDSAGDGAGLLSTLIVDSQVLSFEVASNKTALCSNIRTDEGDTGVTTNGSAVVTDSGCPYSGAIALGFTIPLASSYPLTTITTNLLALDPSSPALHLACYDLSFTPYYPDYFAYNLVHYRDPHRHPRDLPPPVHRRASLTSRDGGPSHRGMWRSIWFGAWAGKQVVASGSLRRYVTAEFRELFGLVAWFALVGTVAVTWPGFAYPVFRRAAWTTLVFNSSLPFVSPADPVLPQNTTLPSAYASQIADVTSPLYLDPALPNVLLDLDGERDGLERWSRMIGVRHEDVWSICAFTFFALCAGAIVAHVVVFAFDSALAAVFPKRRAASPHAPIEDKAAHGQDESLAHAMSKEHVSTPDAYGDRRRSDGSMGRFLGSGDFADDDYFADDDELARANPDDEHPLWRLHAALLQGNLTRLVLLFHLPLSLFSAYQFTLYSSAPSSTFALAVVVFALVCVAYPAFALWQIHVKSTRTLYGHLPTLLALGPLYNTYAEECILFPLVTLGSNLVIGVVVGAGQASGTAQAAIILIVEVAHTLCTSLWLPWGDNAAMGPLAFLLSLARIIIAVLLVVLSPTVDVSPAAASWVAYIVFLAMGLVILLLIGVVAFKVLELVVRLVGRVPFDESRSPRGGGLFGALRKSRGGRAGGASGGKKRRAADARSQVARRRAVEERRRRHLHLEHFAGGTVGGRSDASSVGTATYMLPSAQRPAGHPGAGGSTLSLGSGPSPFPSTGLVDDEGYIMSAMSSRGWENASDASSSVRPGFVRPGAYASSGPILRSGPQHWGSQINVATTGPSPASAIVVAAPVVHAAAPGPAGGSSGFTRVGGGRASHSNPYQLANAGITPAGTAYPPYPASSADLYAPRRPSAGGDPVLAGMAPAQRQASRPSLSALPYSSALLSNQVSPGGRLDDEHNRRLSTRVRARRGDRQGGFFGRFKRQRVQYSDDEYTDESDTDDEAGGRRAGGGLLAALSGGFLGGKGRKGRAQSSGGVGHGDGGFDDPREEDEPPFEPAPEEQKGFSVVRKPRPGPPPGASPGVASTDFGAAQQTTPGSASMSQADPLLEQQQQQRRSTSDAPTPPPPHVSVEAPSRPGSLHGEVVVGEWDDSDHERD